MIEAAKAVIEMWDRCWLVGTDLKIKKLRAAVERAESVPKPGLEQLIERIRFLEKQIAERKKQ